MWWTLGPSTSLQMTSFIPLYCHLYTIRCKTNSLWERAIKHRKFSSVLRDALEGWGGGKVGGRFKRAGIYVYIWLIHFIMQQKLTQNKKQYNKILRKKGDKASGCRMPPQWRTSKIFSYFPPVNSSSFLMPILFAVLWIFPLWFYCLFYYKKKQSLLGCWLLWNSKGWAPCWHCPRDFNHQPLDRWGTENVSWNLWCSHFRSWMSCQSLSQWLSD